MTSVVWALSYVAVRTTIRRAVAVARSPVRLALLVVAVAAFVFLQTRGVDHGGVAPRYALVVPVALLGVLGAGGALRCPVRLRTADVAWVLPMANGPRALMLYKILAMFGGFLAFGLVGAGAGRVVEGQASPGVIGCALGLAVGATLIRMSSYLSFVLVSRGVPRYPLAGFWIAVALVSAVAGGPLSGMFDNLFGSVLAPSDGWRPWGTAMGAAVLAVLAWPTVALADRYQDAAARLAWEFAALRAAMREDRGNSGRLAEMTTHRLRRGVLSLPAGQRFAGEAAFAWRAIAQLRRTWRRDAIGALPVVAVSAGLAVWTAPRTALIPLGLATVLALAGISSTGLADELDRGFFHITPGRLGRQLLAIELVPFLTTAATLVAIWLPVAILARHVGFAFRGGGVLASLALAAMIVSAGSAAASRTRSITSRLGLTMAGGAAVVLLAAVAQVLATPDPQGPGWVFALSALAGAVCLHTVGVRSVRRSLPRGA